MRSMNNRECGAVEAADTCLGHFLYGTDNDTSIKWLNVFMIKNKKLIPKKDLDLLDPESEDIFYPCFINYYYANRSQELDAICLYDFAS